MQGYADNMCDLDAEEKEFWQEPPASGLFPLDPDIQDIREAIRGKLYFLLSVAVHLF